MFGDLLKTSKAGRHIAELNLPAFEAGEAFMYCDDDVKRVFTAHK